MMMEQSKLDVNVTDAEGLRASHYICGAAYGGEEPFTVEKDVEQTEHNDEQTVDRAGGNDMTKTQTPTDPSVLEQLLRRAANPNLRTSRGDTALRFVLQSKKEALLPKLLDPVDPEVVGDGVMPMDESHGRICLDSMQETIVEYLHNHERLFPRTLSWAARDKARHKLAKALLSYKVQDGIDQTASVIEWATHRVLPRILWWLIATSPRGQQTQRRIDAAKNAPRNAGVAGDEGENHAGVPEPRAMGPRTTEEASPNVEETAISDQDMISRILEEPPTGQVYREGGLLTEPKRKLKDYGVLKEFRSHVMRFYKGDSISSTIRRYQDVDDAIYTKGSTKIMDIAAARPRKLLQIEASEAQDIESKELQDLYDLEKLQFTWIHLRKCEVPRRLAHCIRHTDC
jgi:hypothetical protein